MMNIKSIITRFAGITYYTTYSPYPKKKCDNGYKVYIISKDLIEKELTKDEYVDIINQYQKYLKIQPMSDRHILDKGQD